MQVHRNFLPAAGLAAVSLVLACGGGTTPSTPQASSPAGGGDGTPPAPPSTLPAPPAPPVAAPPPPPTSTDFTPVVGDDGGPIGLVVAAEPGSACAAWLPQPSDPETKTVESQFKFIWGEPITDGVGHLGFPLQGTWSQVGFFSDGTFSRGPVGRYLTPQAHGFLFVQVGGPCLICDATLTKWPGGNSLPLGNGYSFSTNCTYAASPGGNRVFTSCLGPAAAGGVSIFAKYDEYLTLLSSRPGDGMDFIAADALDRILEANASHGWRWLDSNGIPLTGFFAGGENPQPLIGGGFLDRSGRIVASGSASVSQAPSWLTERSSVSIVLGGRAYALGDDDCGLVIRDKDGTLCGKLDFVNCRTPPRPGFDGTVVLPTITGEYVFEQNLAGWPGLLR
jgi:hypothetical protein